MVFADLKNDFVFRRIFATHPELLRGLLNDLLERSGEHIIEGIEYLPSEQLPLVEGAKLSILDVRCKDRKGTTYVVEMQLLHHVGFVSRVVFNACKAYAGQLKAAQWYTKLADVVAVSICDFELWPDARQDKNSVPRVPMLSGWNMTEQHTGHRDLLQVQYAFLELPKLLTKPRPVTPGADLWAWLFAHAPELTEVPADLAAGPYRDALDLANQAKFTQEELDAYERSRYEIRQVIEIAASRRAEGVAEGMVKGKAEGMTEGKAEGMTEGVAKGKAEAVLAVLAARAIPVTDEARVRIEACKDIAVLEQWISRAVTAASVDEVLAPPV